MAATLPALTEETVCHYLPTSSFDQGQHLYREGRLFNTLCRGNQLEGYCEGARHERHRASVVLGSEGIVSDSCTCAIGTACKHVAALLVAWVHEPRRFPEREAVNETLAKMGRNELMALVQEMLRRAPELERLLDLPLLVPGTALVPNEEQRTPVDAERYRRQLRYAMRGTSEDDWTESTEDLAREIASIVDIGERFGAQGDWENAQGAYQAILDEVLPGYGMLYDEGEVADELRRAVTGLGDCLEARVKEPRVRRTLLQALLDSVRWNIDYGRVNISGAAPGFIVDYAMPEDREALRQAILAAVAALPQTERGQSWRHEAWGRLLLELDERDGNVERFLKSAEEEALYWPLFETLVRLGRLEEATHIARHHLTETLEDRMRAAEALEQAGRPLEGLQLAEAGLANDPSEKLAPWLAERYEQNGEPERALALHQSQWKSAPSVELYEMIEELATSLDQWGDLQPTLIEALEQQHRWAMLSRLHLREEAWEQAWEAAGREGAASLRLEVAQAAEALHPEWAIQAYTEEAERRIRHRGRDSYAVAARYLRRVRDLYQQAEREQEWKQFIGDLRERYQHLGTFDEQLKKAGL
ncbi:MAG: hypothetical protein H0T73_20325 [Ardenticatenales bacterium]|nr:hypothetical protein [Ardenticatenales bacterium]